MLYKMNNLELYYFNKRVNEAMVRKSRSIPLKFVIREGIKLYNKLNKKSIINNINYRLIEINSAGEKRLINFGIEKKDNGECFLIITDNIDIKFNVYILFQYSDDKKNKNCYFLDCICELEDLPYHYKANFVNCVDIPFFRNSLKEELPPLYNNTNNLLQSSSINLSERLIKSYLFQKVRYLYLYLDSKQIKSLYKKFRSEFNNKNFFNNFNLNILDEYSFYLLDRIILNYKKKSLNNLVDYYIVHSKALIEIEILLRDLNFNYIEKIK